MNEFDHRLNSSRKGLFKPHVHSDFPGASADPLRQVDGGPSTEAFLKLYLKHECRIQAFVLSVVPNPSDAEEVLQETVLILWKKFGEFSAGTDFTAWACRIAKFRALKHYEKQQRQHARFRPAVLEAVAEEVRVMGPLLDARHRALSDCLSKLCSRDQDLLQRRYVYDASPQEIAGQVGRSVDAVYKALARIRASLMACIQRKLAAEGVT